MKFDLSVSDITLSSELHNHSIRIDVNIMRTFNRFRNILLHCFVVEKTFK